MFQVGPCYDQQLKAAVVAAVTCKHKSCMAIPLNRNVRTFTINHSQTSTGKYEFKHID